MKIVKDFIKKNFNIFLLGFFSILSYEPFNFTPALPISFAVFLLLIKDRITDMQIGGAKKQVFISFYIYGFGFYLASLYWLSAALLLSPKFYFFIPFSLMALPMILSIYHGLFGLLFAIKFSNLFLRTIFLSCAFIVIEFLRANLFTGLPWNLYGYAIASVNNIAQICSIFGVFSLSFLVIYLSVSLGFFLIDKNKPNFCNLIFAISLIFLSYVYGGFRVQEVKWTDKKVMIVQPGTHKELLSKEYIYRSFQDLMYVTKANYSNEDLVIWPEDAIKSLVNLHYNNDFSKLTSSMKENSYLVTGANSYKNDLFHNSILVISQSGSLESYHHKSKLIPFGEYIPFREFLPLGTIVGGHVNFTAGDAIKEIKLGNDAIVPLNCYEAILPNINFDRKKAILIVNSTNDSWYGKTTGPYQHAAINKIRSIEFGLPMARSAVTGISLLTDSYGREIKYLELNSSGSISSKIPQSLDNTLFLRYNMGSKFIIICFIIAITCFLFRKN